jgi:hypothetical protein
MSANLAYFERTARSLLSLRRTRDPLAMRKLYKKNRQRGEPRRRRAGGGWKKVSVMAVLEKERKVYAKQRPELLKTHAGQFALIHDDELVGTYTSFAEAYGEGVKKFGTEPFFIQEIRADDQQAQTPALDVGALARQ